MEPTAAADGAPRPLHFGPSRSPHRPTLVPPVECGSPVRPLLRPLWRTTQGKRPAAARSAALRVLRRERGGGLRSGIGGHGRRGGFGPGEESRSRESRSPPESARGGCASRCASGCASGQVGMIRHSPPESAIGGCASGLRFAQQRGARAGAPRRWRWPRRAAPPAAPPSFRLGNANRQCAPCFVRPGGLRRASARRRGSGRGGTPKASSGAARSP
jgi:hypothetical protein